ncbi:MAG: cytochrome d ubiquinol oxidase subunit II [Endomicrobia bacterium]|nr:cytochrome d ubiquinol oxidase subunit II [Endomicrobiia bacterium]
MDLQVVWFVLWCLLWIVYFSLDGFDLGVGILHKFLPTGESEKKLMLSSIGPFWDGNEVWLITAGGATFAAFPSAYADMFSWFYLPLFFVLLCLIIRGVSVEFRNKVQNAKILDFLIFLSSFIVSFLFGLFFSNIWAGVEVEDGVYKKGVIGLLNFKGIIGGIVFCLFFIYHGLNWLNIRVEGYFKLKISNLIKKFWYIVLFSFGIFIIFLPQAQRISQTNLKYFVAFLYLFSIVMLYLNRKALIKGLEVLSFIFSFFFIFFFMSGGFLSQYPYIIPFIDGGISIFNASASKYTLKLMTIVAVIFVPIVVIYQIWIYKLLYHKIDSNNEINLYNN